MSTKIIGIDCDGNVLKEFMVLRTPFYSDIDFEEEPKADPRQYCVLQGADSKWHLMSVCD